jgi:hypothetical protein
MRIACWITKATNTHSGYVILIVSPLQQRLHERAPVMLYVRCLSCGNYLLVRTVEGLMTLIEDGVLLVL